MPIACERFRFLEQIKKHHYKRLLSHNKSKTYHYLKTDNNIHWSKCYINSKTRTKLTACLSI